MELCSHLQESICPLPVQRTSRLHDLLNDTGSTAGKVGGCWVGGRQLVCSGSKRSRKSGGSCVVVGEGGWQQGGFGLQEGKPHRKQACGGGDTPPPGGTYCRQR